MPSQEQITPRQRVLTALAHQQPDRVPFSWGFGPTPEMTLTLQAYFREQEIDWGRLRAAVEHIVGVGPAYTGPDLPQGTDIWGVRRKPTSYGAGVYDEIEYYPLSGIAHLAQADAYPWPDPKDYDYAGLRGQTERAYADGSRATKLAGGNPFEIYSWMTGLEETLVNLVVNPQLVMTCLNHITTFFETRLRYTLTEIGDFVDMVFLADDLGGQHGLLMSREKYCEVLQPFHRRLADTVHELAPHAKILFHSDGSVFDILPDLIDAGIDILEAVQVDAAKMDPQSLKATYGSRISFHGGISVQQLLPHSTAEQVEETCRHLVRILGEGGGYIAAPTHAIQAGTPPENVLAILRGVLGDEHLRVTLDESCVNN